MTSSTEARRAARSSPRGSFEGNVGLGQGLLGAHDALRHGRFGDQEGARDLVGGETAEHAQGQGDPRLGGQHRVAGGEHQPQHVVADVLVDGLQHRVVLGVRVELAGLEVAADLLLFAAEPLVSPDQVDGAVFGGGHEPGPRVVRDTRLRPLLQRGDERVLGEFLGEADVAHDARDACDQSRGLDPPHGVDRPMYVTRVQGHHDAMTSVLARERKPVSCRMPGCGCAPPRPAVPG